MLRPKKECPRSAIISFSSLVVVFPFEGFFLEFCAFCDVRFSTLMSPYSRYRPLPGSDGISVLQTPPGCRPTPPSACRFLRWISKLSPQPVNKQTLGEAGTLRFFGKVKFV